VLRSGEPLKIPPLPAHTHVPESLQLSASVELARPGNALTDAIDVVFRCCMGRLARTERSRGSLSWRTLRMWAPACWLVGRDGQGRDEAVVRSRGLPMTPHLTLLRSEWPRRPKRVTKLIERVLAYPCSSSRRTSVARWDLEGA